MINVPDYMTDMFDLITYVTGLTNIIWGNQSREVLPEDDDFCIYTPITQQRVGSNLYKLDAAGVADTLNAPCTDSKLLQINIQLDFYGESAFKYADGFETFCRSLRCNEWLTQTGKDIRVLYSSAPIDATLVDDTQQYVNRWTTTVSIVVTTGFTEDIPWFEDVTVEAVKDVDVYFKP